MGDFHDQWNYLILTVGVAIVGGESIKNRLISLWSAGRDRRVSQCAQDTGPNYFSRRRGHIPQRPIMEIVINNLHINTMAKRQPFSKTPFFFLPLVATILFIQSNVEIHWGKQIIKDHLDILAIRVLTLEQQSRFLSHPLRHAELCHDDTAGNNAISRLLVLFDVRKGSLEQMV